MFFVDNKKFIIFFVFSLAFNSSKFGRFVTLFINIFVVCLNVVFMYLNNGFNCFFMLYVNIVGLCMIKNLIAFFFTSFVFRNFIIFCIFFVLNFIVFGFWFCCIVLCLNVVDVWDMICSVCVLGMLMDLRYLYLLIIFFFWVR